MSEIRFDTYYRYEDLARILKGIAESRPDLVRIDTIGRSYEGRDIWLATVTRFSTGGDKDKPALWVDGNIHATEVAGSMACLYLLQHLVNRYGGDADITRCLDTRVFYICPRLNPDGAEWALADVPRLIRSSTRPYPFDEEPSAGCGGRTWMATGASSRCGSPTPTARGSFPIGIRACWCGATRPRPAAATSV